MKVAAIMDNPVAGAEEMEEKLIKVLLVESDRRFTRYLQESLSGLTSSRVDLFSSENLEEAISCLRENTLDAALLDLDLSDSEGISTFARFHEAAPGLPTVILTGSDHQAVALEAVRQGAQDYLVNSKVDGKILSRVIRYAIEGKQNEMKLVAANRDLLKTNHDLARSEETLRRALEELRASHEQLKAAQLQLIQAEKLECVGTLAAGVAHEVKNPLQTILMGLAFLSRNAPAEDKDFFMVLGDMRDAVKRADAIVRDLLYLSAAKQMEMKEDDINAVIAHSLCFVNYDLTRSRVRVVCDLAKNLPTVRLDRPKMDQVFINLFMNAIHAMPTGGELHLRTRLARWPEGNPGDATATKRFEAGDPIVLIEIEDTGTGIPAEKLSRIFEPFFTTKPSGVGTGLGLPVSKQIVDLHGGTIQIGPGSRRGARVTLTLKVEQE